MNVEEVIRDIKIEKRWKVLSWKWAKQGL